ncbi:MAG: IS66 family transposase [Gammaproteobacteria bacterium]|nr:IS66 family transposase [Gammaproteobacteria bacterium]MBU1653415.1 IS66 family transposase [Gammaproteobacteria bacterium]MBU1959720.1 IS66 family transposase [Gammaproteobacteria bacterium]
MDVDDCAHTLSSSTAAATRSKFSTGRRAVFAYGKNGRHSRQGPGIAACALQVCLQNLRGRRQDRPPSAATDPQEQRLAGFAGPHRRGQISGCLAPARQEAILGRAGIELKRHTLAGWMIRCAAVIDPLINLLREGSDAYDIRLMDETPVQVLVEEGRSPTARSYMWLQRGGPPDQPVILFVYDPSRSGAVPKQLLADYKGWLMTDGYDGYNHLSDDIVRVGCWAHARRKFDEAIKAQGKKDKAKPKTGRAHQGLAYIQALYRIEREAKDRELSPEDRGLLRQQKARPILDDLKAWLDKSLPHVPPKSAIGNALHYLNNQWPYLIRYLEDGRLPIDNNLAERAIRPFVIGRKNWLFSATPAGAHASAKLYSLIETAKANGHEPYAYLHQVFKKLPAATTVEEIEQLLPWNITPEEVTGLSV